MTLAAIGGPSTQISQSTCFSRPPNDGPPLTQEVGNEARTDDRHSIAYIDASPESLYALISDVTRTPEYSPEVVKCTWIKDATGPAVDARFKAINPAGRVPDWPNKPIVTVAEPSREVAFERGEVGAGTSRCEHEPGTHRDHRRGQAGRTARLTSSSDIPCIGMSADSSQFATALERII